MSFESALSGGDPRSLVGVEDAVRAVLADPARAEDLLDCCSADDAVVRVRAADALEKVARESPATVAALVDRIFADVGASSQPSVQWHVAQILSEVPLTATQRRRAVEWLVQTLDHAQDWIVLTNAITALAALASTDPRTQLLAQRLTRDPRKAVAKRAAKVLAAL